MIQAHGLRSSKSSMFDYGVDAIVGRRSEQQDSAHCMGVTVGGRPAMLLILADGMGGAAGGRLASTTAVAAFESRFREDASSDLPARLQGALDAANAAIAREIKRDRALEGMGCTLVGVVTDGRHATWVSVGDSLLLMAKDGDIDRLNDDHSLAAVLDRAAERGDISRGEAASSPQRSMLRSALTGETITLTDRGSVELPVGARLIVATDGILTLSFSRIAKLSQQATSAEALVSAILEAVQLDMPSDQDNLTVAVAVSPWLRRATHTRAPLWAKVAIGVGMTTLIGAAVALALINRPRPEPKPYKFRSGMEAAAPIDSTPPLPPDRADPLRAINPNALPTATSVTLTARPPTTRHFTESARSGGEPRGADNDRPAQTSQRPPSSKAPPSAPTPSRVDTAGDQAKTAGSAPGGNPSGHSNQPSGPTSIAGILDATSAKPTPSLPANAAKTAEPPKR